MPVSQEISSSFPSTASSRFQPSTHHLLGTNTTHQHHQRKHYRVRFTSFYPSERSPVPRAFASVVGSRPKRHHLYKHKRGSPTSLHHLPPFSPVTSSTSPALSLEMDKIRNSEDTKEYVSYQGGLNPQVRRRHVFGTHLCTVFLGRIRFLLSPYFR